MATHREPNHTPGLDTGTVQGSKQIVFNDIHQLRHRTGGAVQHTPHVQPMSLVLLPLFLPAIVRLLVHQSTAMVGTIEADDNQMTFGKVFVVIEPAELFT